MGPWFVDSYVRLVAVISDACGWMPSEAASFRLGMHLSPVTTYSLASLHSARFQFGRIWSRGPQVWVCTRLQRLAAIHLLREEVQGLDLVKFVMSFS